jgi:hypothetical protein
VLLLLLLLRLSVDVQASLLATLKPPSYKCPLIYLRKQRFAVQKASRAAVLEVSECLLSTAAHHSKFTRRRTHTAIV